MLFKEKNLSLYDISPKIVPIGREVTFTLRTIDPQLFRKMAFKLMLYGANDGLSTPLCDNVPYKLLEAPEYGCTFTLTLAKEQQYEIYVMYENTSKRSRGHVSVYALEDDLLARTPLIGDFHAHTYYSDGREGPIFVAAEYRKNGYDFTTITDHRRLEPSLMATEAFKEFDIPFRVYQGEEVHPEGIHTHIVNFAPDRSTNAFALLNHPEENPFSGTPTPEWNEAMEKTLATLTDLPEGVDAKEVASAILVTDHIRKNGGMSILAHPHWIWRTRNVPDQTTRYMLQTGMFDALELIGGLDWYENQSQVAFYEQLCREGLEVPIVGSSDQHGTLPGGLTEDTVNYFTEERTLVLATGNTREEIADAVKGHFTVAIQKFTGQFPIVAGGSYRLKQYALFLLREYLPLRDELYFTEGRLLHEALAGVPGAKEQLYATVKYHAYFEDKYFCR